MFSFFFTFYRTKNVFSRIMWKKGHCMMIINEVKSILLPDTLESRAIRVSQQGDR